MLEIARRGPTTAIFFPPEQCALLAIPIGSNETRPLRGSEVLEQFPDALLVVNGPMFSRCATEAPQREGQSQASWYAGLQCVVADYLQSDSIEGMHLPGRYDERGMTFSVLPDATVAVAMGAQPSPGASIAIQTYPALVHDGRLTTVRDDPEIVWRGALGEVGDGRLAFIVSQAGMRDFQKICRDVVGVRNAGYLDGGGSLLVLGRDGLRIGARENRPVGTWLAVMEPSITRDVERYARAHPVITVAATAGAIAGLLAVGYYLTRPAVHSRRGRTRR